MTVAELKISIAGFMQREPSVFVRTVGVTTVDLLLLACNNARLYAERLIDFELSKKDCKVVMSLANGGDLDTAMSLDTVPVSVKVKKVITPFMQAMGGGQYPVELWSRKRWSDRMLRKYEMFQPTDRPLPTVESKAFVVLKEGKWVWVAPADGTQLGTSFDLFFNVVSWLPDYTTGGGLASDFLTTYCSDWMLFYSISQLNFYLKEDERVQLSAAMLADTWHAVIRWNDELTMSAVDDVSLD